MIDHSFLNELLIVIGMATCLAVLCERLHLSATVGFLLSGVLAGPHGFALLEDQSHMHLIAELGVVFLMFTVGAEFSLKRLQGLGAVAFFGGAAQMGLSIGIGLSVSSWAGWNIYQGFIFGSVLALSSTAVVLKFLIDRGELDSPHGRLAMSILVFQDIAVVPLMIVASTFTGAQGDLLPALGQAAFKAFLFIFYTLMLWRLLLSKFLHWVASTRNREVFLLTVLMIGLGSAVFSSVLGLSMALGAFVAGLLLANTDYDSQSTGDIVPFRHVFVSLFFVSLGLLLDPLFIWNNWPLLLGVVSLVLFVNFVVTAAVVFAFGYPMSIALGAGLVLAQIGEFSFLILEIARGQQGISEFFYQMMLCSAFLTILFTPLLFFLTKPLLELAEKVPFFGMSLPRKPWKKREEVPKMSGHVIICGFGRVGQDLAITLLKEKTACVVIDVNPVNLAAAKRLKLPVIYGDAGNESVMLHASIKQASSLIVGFGNSQGVDPIVRVAQRLNPEAFVLVRSRYEKDAAKLYALGADSVIMEEHEASLEIHRVLFAQLKKGKPQLEAHLERIRMRKEFLIEQEIFNPDPDNN